MSYILKALKKSEAERTKGTVPRLTPQQAPPPRTRSAIWPWVIGAALVVNATVVGFAAWGPEIPLLPGGGPQDDETSTSAPSAPVADGLQLSATAPKAPANGSEPQGPAVAQAAVPPRASQTQDRRLEVPVAQQQKARQPSPVEQRQARQVRPAEPGQARQPQPSVQPQHSEQPAVGQPQAPQPNVPAQPQVREQLAATQPQAEQPRPARQARTASSPVAAQRQTRAADADGQDLQEQTAAVGAETADQSGTMPVSPVASSTRPSTAPGTPAARTAPSAAAPKPVRKPREALGRSIRRPVLGDPLPLGSGARAPKPAGSEVALAAPEPAPPVAEVDRAPEPDPFADVPMLWQLPSAIRSRLPKLNISVHVYSPEATGRFVIVERSKYREGDVVGGGAKLEAILADGIVLDYQGRRYRIGN